MGDGQAIESHTESSPNAPNIGQVTAIQRPDWVEEKFYDAKTGVIDFEAQARSYRELQAKMSGAPAKEEPAPEPTTEPAKVEPPGEMPVVPGIKPESMKAYSEELTKDGALSEKSYAELLAAGFNKAAVNAYVKGITSESVVSQAVSAARVADSEINAITESIGGKAALGEMQKWAIASLPDKELKAYNEAVSGSDPAKVKLAVHGLYSQFTKANGTGENLLTGSNGGVEQFDVFESRAEQSRAINNPLYQTDKAYRDRVSAKIGRSKI